MKFIAFERSRGASRASRRHVGALASLAFITLTACQTKVIGPETDVPPDTCDGAPGAGTVSGAQVEAVFCAGSVQLATFAPHVTPGETYSEPYIVAGHNVTDVATAVPAQGTLALSLFTGISAAAPGTYGSAHGDCGGFSFCVDTPVPAGLDCGTDPSNCPPGCALEGPELGPTCQPSTPNVCYATASANVNCIDQDAPSPAQGSWTLELTSVAPVGPSPQMSEIHGSLEATMISGNDTATLSVTF